MNKYSRAFPSLFHMNWFILILFNRIYQTPILLSVYKGLKYIIHITTQTSEIYRLCNITSDSTKVVTPSNAILYRLDKSIFYSTELQQEKYELEQPFCEIQAVTERISIKKKLNTSASEILLIGLTRIYETNQVLYTVEQQVHTKYDSSNELHEKKLLSLWNKMKPDEALIGRRTKQWVDIGFQGTDPATDFRGMGMQGLDDLLYFIETYPNHATSILQHASHPISWYPYAIVGINITKFGYQLLESKRLQLFLFQYHSFQEFYCYLFHQFNQFWIHHDPILTVMDFEVKFNQFKIQIEKDLLLETIKPLDK